MVLLFVFLWYSSVSCCLESCSICLIFENSLSLHNYYRKEDHATIFGFVE